MEESHDLFKDIDEHKDSIYVLQHDLTQMVLQHTHHQGHLLVVKDGVARVEVEGSAYYIPYGHFVWIPEEVSHRISFDTKKITLLNIYFPPHTNKDPFFSSVGVYSIPSLLYHTFELVQEHTASFTTCDMPKCCRRRARDNKYNRQNGEESQLLTCHRCLCMLLFTRGDLSVIRC